MGRSLPPDLAAFFTERALGLDGRIWDGAPFGTSGGRVETQPAPRAPAERVPLCSEGSNTLWVRWAPPHPVSLENETPVAESLAAFEASLLPKLSRISPSIAAARALLRSGEHAGAAAAFEVILRAFELGHSRNAPWVSIERNLELGAVYNDLGICHRRLGDVRRAEELWRTGLEEVGDPPQLRKNLVDLLLSEERFDEVVAIEPRATVSSQRRDLAYLRAARAIAFDRMRRAADRDAELAEAAAHPDDVDLLTRNLLDSHRLALPPKHET